MTKDLEEITVRRKQSGVLQYVDPIPRPKGKGQKSDDDECVYLKFGFYLWLLFNCSLKYFVKEIIIKLKL